MAGAWMASGAGGACCNGNHAWQSNEIGGAWALTPQHAVPLDLLTVRETQAFILLLTTRDWDKKSYKVVYFTSQAHATRVLAFFMPMGWSAERGRRVKQTCRKNRAEKQERGGLRGKWGRSLHF